MKSVPERERKHEGAKTENRKSSQGIVNIRNASHCYSANPLQFPKPSGKPYINKSSWGFCLWRKPWKKIHSILELMSNAEAHQQPWNRTGQQDAMKTGSWESNVIKNVRDSDVCRNLSVGVGFFIRLGMRLAWDEVGLPLWQCFSSKCLSYNPLERNNLATEHWEFHRSFDISCTITARECSSLSTLPSGYLDQPTLFQIWKKT